MPDSDPSVPTPVQTLTLTLTTGKVVRAERYTTRQSEIPGAINWGWVCREGLAPNEKADAERQIADAERRRRDPREGEGSGVDRKD